VIDRGAAAFRGVRRAGDLDRGQRQRVRGRAEDRCRRCSFGDRDEMERAFRETTDQPVTPGSADSVPVWIDPVVNKCNSHQTPPLPRTRKCNDGGNGANRSAVGRRGQSAGSASLSSERMSAFHPYGARKSVDGEAGDERFSGIVHARRDVLKNTCALRYCANLRRSDTSQLDCGRLTADDRGVASRVRPFPQSSDHARSLRSRDHGWGFGCQLPGSNSGRSVPWPR
jgi:hypothetical protein